MNFLRADPNKNGYVNSEMFSENIKRLGINEKVVTDNDI